MRDFFRRIWQRAADNLAFDGLDVAEIAADIERTWSIDFDDLATDDMVTVQDLANGIAEHANISVESVLPRLIAILADRLSRDPTGIRPEATLIDGLDLD